jgi:hypothetical protein
MAWRLAAVFHGTFCTAAQRQAAHITKMALLITLALGETQTSAAKALRFRASAMLCGPTL